MPTSLVTYYDDTLADIVLLPFSAKCTKSCGLSLHCISLIFWH